MTSVLIEKDGVLRHRDSEGRHGEMKAQIRMMHPQAKEHQGLHAASKAKTETWKRFPF